MSWEAKIFEGYFRFLLKAKYFVIVFWIGILLLGVFVGLQFLNETNTTFSAPPGTQAYEAYEVFNRDFSDRPNSIIVFVYTELDLDVTNGGQTGNFCNSFTQLLNTSLVTYGVPGVFNSVTGYFTLLGTFVEGLEKSGVPKLEAQLAAESVLKWKFVSSDFRAMLILISYNRIDGTTEADFIEYVRDLVSDHPDPLNQLTVGVTGMDVLFLDVIQGGTNDMVHNDSIVIPCALVVLGFVIRSLRLMIIPIFGVFCSVFAAYTIMHPIAVYSINVASFTPSIMMSLVIAMSIDYSLFLLTRYREEILRKRDNETSVYLMLQNAGHIVLISGSTLAVTFLGLAFFPLDFLRSIGVGAAVALICTIMVNLSFTPSMLLIFGGFFSDFSLPFSALCCRAEETRPLLERDYDDESYITSSDKQLRTDGDIDGEDRIHPKDRKGFWFKSAKFSTHRVMAMVIILVVFGTCIPVAYNLASLRTTIDNTQLFPDNSPALEIYNRMTDYFPPGELAPYFVLVTTAQDTPGAVLTQPVWNSLCALADMLLANNVVERDNLNAVMGYAGFNVTLPNTTTPLRWIPLSVARALVYDTYGNASRPEINMASSIYRDVFFYSLTDPSNSSTLISLQTSFDPLGDEAEPWVAQTRQLLENFVPPPGGAEVTLYLVGGAVETIDAVNKIYSLFPLEILITAAIVFVIVAVMFRSLFMPIRLLVTIALPICLVYGLGVLVFENNNPFWRKVDAIYWLTPVMSFSILVGLGLDYDVFLFSRIFEYRKEGFDTASALLLGVHKTGGIITAAGVIMAIAFAGLIASKQMVLNEFGFMLCVAVLVDTFIVRTLLVPAIMRMAGEVNWWPGKVPPATRDIDWHFAGGDTHQDIGGVIGGSPALGGGSRKFEIAEDQTPNATRHGSLSGLSDGSPARGNGNGVSSAYGRPLLNVTEQQGGTYSADYSILPVSDRQQSGAIQSDRRRGNSRYSEDGL